METETRATSSTKTNSAALVAQSIARKGLRVFPIVHGGKWPTEAGWQERATNVVKNVAAVFGGDDELNIGIATGDCVGADGDAKKVFVVDVDGADGQAFLDSLGILTPTLESITGRDSPGYPGRHHFYYWPDDDCPTVMSIPRRDENGKPVTQTKTNKHGEEYRETIAAGVDIRGQGGYVVAPGSTHENGKKYRWARDCEIQPAPAWLVDFIRREKSFTQSKAATPDEIARQKELAEKWARASDEASQKRIRAWGEASLRAICDHLSCVGDGVKHNELCIAGLKAGTLTPHAVSMSEARDAILDVVNGWGKRVKNKRAAVKTIDQKLETGALTPRWPDDRPHPIYGDDLKIVTDDDVKKIIDSVVGKPSARAVEISAEIEAQKKETKNEKALDIGVIGAPPVISARRRELVDSINRDVAHQRKALDMIAAIGPNIANLVDWVANELIPQPHLEALTIGEIGKMWCGRQDVTRTGLIASGVTIGVSASGTGKSSAFACFGKCALSPSAINAGNFPSVQSLRKALVDATMIYGHGVTFAGSEIGKSLSALFGHGASSFRADVAPEILACTPMHSEGHHSFQMSVKDGNGNTIYLQAPHLSIYGTTTETALRKMLTGEASEDGLFGRSLILPGVDGNDPLRDGKFHRSMPDDVEKLLKRAQKSSIEWFKLLPSSGTNDHGLTIKKYSPIVARYDETAIAMLENSRRELGFRALEVGEGPQRTILRRCQEQIEKLCIAYAKIESPESPFVTPAIVQAAFFVVARSAEFASGLQARATQEFEMMSTPHGRAIKAIERVLLRVPGQWVSMTDVSKGARGFTAQIREAAINDLISHGKAQKEKIPAEAGRPSIFLRAI